MYSRRGRCLILVLLIAVFATSFVPDARQNSYREPPLPTPAANYSEDDDEEEDTSFSQVRGGMSDSTSRFLVTAYRGS